MPNEHNIFEPHAFNLASILDYAYEVPAYQRPYSWKSSEHVRTLLDDIFTAYLKYKHNHTEIYYTGTYYYNYKCTLPGGKICNYVIDGQQRITTYALMFLCLYSLSKINKINDYNAQFSLLENTLLWKNDGQRRNRTLKFLELNSLDKNFFENIFNHAFDEPKKLFEYVNEYNCLSKADERIKDNFISIYNFYGKNLFSEKAIEHNEPQMYLNFLLNQISMIGIKTDFPTKKIFEMFESINSKFKRLDDIDLIKTYIFKCIDEQSYDAMLNRWSALIQGTDDNLDDYLLVYIRAYIKHVSNLKSFTTSLIDLIKDKFNLNSETSAVKKLLDELEKWLPCYQQLIKLEKAKAIIGSSEFETYHRIFTILNYEHPKALLFRCFCHLKEGRLNKNDVTKIWKFSTLYMLMFKSIMNQDSKSSIKVFSDICDEIKQNDVIDVIAIINKFKESLSSKSITPDSCMLSLQKSELYGKPIAFPVLSLICSIDTKSDSGIDSDEDPYSVAEVDYDMAAIYLKQYKSNTLHIDHIMVQDPKDDSNLKYRVITGNFGHEYLKLLPGADFPLNINGIDIKDGMSYQTFKALTINCIGNLRILTGHINIARRNNATYLGDDANVTTYEEMSERGAKLTKYFFKCKSLQIK